MSEIRTFEASFALSGTTQIKSFSASSMLSKPGQILSFGASGHLNHVKSFTASALITDPQGTFRGSFTTADRDALPALQPQDTVLTSDAETADSGINVPRWQYWDGTDWISGSSVQSPVSGVTNLFVAPTLAGWRVELGDPTYPLRYWDGSTARFTVDDAGDAYFAGSITASSIDIPDATTTNSFHVDTNGRMWIGKDGSHFSTAPFRVGATGIAVIKAATIQPLNSTSIALTLNDDQASTSPLVSLQSAGSEVGYISSGGSFVSENDGSFDIYANTTDSWSEMGLGPTSLVWGAGGSSAWDVTLSRSAASILRIDNAPAASGAAIEMVERTAPGTPASNKIRLYAKDKSGTSALYYKDDGGTEHDLSAATGLALNITTHAGAVSDSDFTSPTSGDIGIDTTNSRLYVRVGSTWKYVELA